MATSLPAEQLGASILASPIATAVLGRRAKSRPGADEVFDELAALHGDLLWKWLREYGRSDRRLADKLMAAVRDPGMTGSVRLRRALELTQLVAGVLTDREVDEVCAFLQVRADQPLDPYEDNALVHDSRAALVEMVFAHPKLVQRLLPSGHVFTTLPSAAEAVAAAERRRRRPNADQMIEALRALSSSPGLAVDFADIASDTSGKKLMDRPLDPRRSPWRRLARTVVTTLSVVSGPLLVACAHRLAVPSGWPKFQPVGIAEALVALTLIATVHVFTVTLSAQRLPGAIASVVGRPRAVITCYSTSLALVFTSLAPDSPGLEPVAATYLASALVAVFTLSLVVVMVGIVRRTDPARAADAFVNTWEAKAVRQGRRLGRLQATATHVGIVIDSLVGVDVGIEPELVGSRRRVFAPRAGLLVPSERRVRGVASTPSVEAGDIEVRLVGGMGGFVSPQEQIATLAAPWSGAIPEVLVRKTAGALRIKSVGGVNDIAAAATALVAMAVDLAAQRQFGTAREVASSATRFIGLHADAARDAWAWHVRRLGWLSDRRARRRAGNVMRPETPPPAGTRSQPRQMAIPALRDSAQRLIEARVGTGVDLGDIPEEMLRVLLELSRATDSTTAIIAAHLPSTFEGTKPSPSVLGVYFELAALRAMEQDDEWTLVLLLDKLAKLSAEKSEMVGEASVVVAISVWVMPSHAASLVQWLQDRGSGASVQQGLARVGASAVAAGQFGTAVRCAQALMKSGADRPALRQAMFGSAGLALDEGFRSQIRGSYLGSSPADAFDVFFKLWQGLDEPAP